MRLNVPTLHERILGMSKEQLEQLATSEALAMADSSRIEGLILDQERIKTELLTGYHLIQSQKHPTA